MSSDELYHDHSERERALRYSRTQEWLVLVGTAWGMLTSVLALTFGLSSRLRDRSLGWSTARLGPVMPYAVLGALASFVTSLPLSYYGGWVVEHRYGLSNQSRRDWFLEQLKGLGVGLVLGTPLMQGVYWVIDRYPRRWWAILSGLTVPFSILLVNLAPVLLLPLFNKFKPLENQALDQRIKDLAAGEGVHVSQVLQMDMSKQTKKANAMFTGLGNSKRIVLGDTLLEEFTEDEVEVVLAHELGHQVHHDIWKLILVSAPTSVIGLLAAHLGTPPLVRRYGQRWGLDAERGVADVAALPLLSLLAGGALQFIRPLTNALTREAIERPADRYALELTGKREAFISAMEKLGRMNLSNPTPNRLVKYLLYDHPPLGERIAFGRSYQSPR